MTEKIFLEKNRNIKSLNKDNKLDISLTQKARLLPIEGISDTLNLAELFESERDNCNKYRLIFDVNTICSNVLFNMKTEIIRNEGQPSCISLIGEECFKNSGYTTTLKTALSNDISSTINPVDHLQAIRNTEYSHAEEGGLVYHCGVDIFNNHMLRSRSFAHVNKVGIAAVDIENSGPVFNTIFDFQRDKDGKIIKEELPNTQYTGKVNTHIYRVDGMMGLEEAYGKRLIEKDGWFGFNNVGYIEIPNGMNNISVNKLMNNNKACEFIDMYPDRTLFSFVPKRNKYYNRIERNWDYCITYPYESDYEKLESVMAFNNGTGEPLTCPNALKAHVITGKTANGHDLLVFKTIIKHNLTYGDSVKLLQYVSGDTLQEQVLVIAGIGDVDGSDTEHCFRIYKDELRPEFQVETIKFIWVRKQTGGGGCKYYFRKFKKILNEEGKTPNNSIGKLGYGGNIYGDRIAEVIYTDDINVEGLKDNLGRPLSELYFTVIKTNRGHELWYNENNFSDPTIEYSHCFGDVTSGIETIPEENDYNVRKLHNIDVETIVDGENLPCTALPNRNYRGTYKTYIGKTIVNNIPLTLENKITENFPVFYGDIVEFNAETCEETVLESIFHRFNTAQRECATNPCYYDLREDVLVTDDYDEDVDLIEIDARGNRKIISREGFTVLSDETGRTETATPQRYAATNKEALETYLNMKQMRGGGSLFPGNLQPEGYFYKAHYPIKIRQISNTLNSQTGAAITYEPVNVYEKIHTGGVSYYAEFSTADDYGYIIGDVFGFFDSVNEELYWGVVSEINKVTESGITKITLTVELNKSIEYTQFMPETMEILLTDGSVPTYASYVSGEQKFVWRDILAPSQVEGNDELSDMMFTNGRNYIHSNINLYVKRQDPFGENGLLFPAKGPDGDSDTSRLHACKIPGYEINHSYFVYKALEMQNDCL